MSLKAIKKTIASNKRFLISTHVNPDPDALCSEVAVALFLKSLGKEVFIVNEEKIPERFQFLPGIKQVKALGGKVSLNYDVAITVDCGDLKRIGKVARLLKEGTPLINIDHHITNDFFGTINLVDPKASSTAEVLYDVFKYFKFSLNKTVAVNLFAGIMTDTGSFRYENTTDKTHRIAGELKSFNFSAVDLYQRFYEAIPLKDLKYFSQVISRFDTLCKGRVIVVELTKSQVKKFSEQFDLRDAIFKFLRQIEGVEAIIILTEAGFKETRINFRSSGRVDVAKIAAYFNGGGHKLASGCAIAKNIPLSRKDVLKQVNKQL